MSEHTAGALTRTEGDAFAFGRVSGFYQGLQHALSVVENVRENADKDTDV
jgi:hypothetical protein